MDSKSLAHTRWKCQYHIVFIPKYRKKVLYNLSDLILLIAMYRPGPMQYLEDMTGVKQGKRFIHYKIPQMESILKSTYGCVAFQEQVQELFKQPADYSYGQADLVRRAMSKKKEEDLEEERHSFIYGDDERAVAGCVKNGISEENANTLFSQLKEFAGYAFNKSHAACYAIVSYQTAWLKYHYTLEYMKSVLNHTSFEKIPGLVMDLKDMGIKFHVPDINCSKQEFRILDGELWFGLGSVKGIGEAAVGVVEERKKNGVFQSLSDFVLRIQPSKNILEEFICSGAMDGFCENRWERLMIEKSVLGVFASRHPITLFPSVRECGAVEIERLQKYHGNQNVTVIGNASDFRKCRRKPDGAEIAFFKLSDFTGEIEVCCFADAYKKRKNF